MRYITQLFRFLLGSGWWRLWYCLFYFVVITGNFAWFGELYDWTLKGESGPAAEAVFIGLISLGGIPLLLFSLLHLILAFWRGADSRKFMTAFGLIFLSLLIGWMIICPLFVAEALFSAFVAYYVCFLIFFLMNLALLWVTQHRSSVKPFLFSIYH
jgi:hypothetical protein